MSRVARVWRVSFTENCAGLPASSVLPGGAAISNGIFFKSVSISCTGTGRDSNLYDFSIDSLWPSRATYSTQGWLASGACPVKCSPLVFLLFERFAGGGIKPLYIVAVLLDRHFDGRSGMLDVVHILDVIERHGARAVDIEVRLQFPMPRIRHEIEPVFSRRSRSSPRNSGYSPSMVAFHKCSASVTPTKGTW